MALFNPSSRELTAKIVYYGPGLSGKTSNLKYIYDHMDEEVRGRMLSLTSGADRTILFDFLPLEMGDTKDATVRIQLYTVPGQVFYEETRKKVLKGADGVVFVADSQRKMAEANVHSLQQLHQHLEANDLGGDAIPLVLQYNKRDLQSILDLEQIDEQLNPGSTPFFEAIASEGVGVEDTLRAISALVLRDLFSRPLESYAAAKVQQPAPAVVDEAEEIFANSEEMLDSAQESAVFDVLPGEFEADDSAELLFVEPAAAGEPFAEPQEEPGAAAPLEHPAGEPETQPPSPSEAPTSEEAPSLHLVPGQPMEAVLDIMGTKFKLRISLEPMPEE